MLFAAVLTAVIELPVFALAGYRKPIQLCYCAAVNLFTNISLNLLLFLATSIGLNGAWRTALICFLELGVVWIEYRLYALLLDRSRRLWLMVVLANGLSCGVGLLLFQVF